MDVIGHFITITKHKKLVMKSCFKVGLYKQGLLHDLSKYTPVEFITGTKFYQGYRSPNTAERELYGYSGAWLHHKGRNKHHFEYWIDYSPGANPTLQGNKMPTRYVVEMFLDRIAASKTYLGDKYTDKCPLEYFLRSREYYLIHEDTMELLEKLLSRLAMDGEEKTLLYIREKVLAHKRKLNIFQRISWLLKVL